MTKTAVIRDKGQITIPQGILKRFQAKRGDVVEFEVKENVIIIRIKKLVDASQAWFWTEDWQKGEREAGADIKAGRIESFKGGEEFLASLE
jgi:bifunctional DNA-binding transcriptional regulator/antitoxin component of YhaV-PrlF toxin-antitoxin module